MSQFLWKIFKKDFLRINFCDNDPADVLDKNTYSFNDSLNRLKYVVHETIEKSLIIWIDHR